MYRAVTIIAFACVRLFLAASILIGLVGVLAAEPIPAGSRIVNIANATYFNPRFGIVETVYSNAVEAIALPVPGFVLNGYSDLRLTRGAIGQHYFTLLNIGNTETPVDLTVDASDEQSLMPGASLHIDLNRNGLIDADETALESGASLFLGFGENLLLIYRFAVVPGAQLGAVSISRLTATSGDLTATGAQGRVTIVEGGLELQKSVARRSQSAGEELRFTLRLRNNSQEVVPAYSEINGKPLVIDGGSNAGILVRDGIPLNTRLVAVGETGGFAPLYHLRGEPRHNYASTLPEDLSLVDAVAFFLAADYPVGRATDLNFSVLLPDVIGNVTVRNIGKTYLPGADGTLTVPSNEIVLDYHSENGAELVFVDPVSLQPTSQGALDTDAILRLRAGACNISAGVDLVQLLVTSLLTGDAETVIARETGANSGTFVSSPLPLADMASPVAQDGVMASRDGDLLEGLARCGDDVVAASMPVAPGNFVFNSLSNASIADVEIQLIDTAGMIVASAVSDPRGYFSLGTVPAGDYRIGVTAPSSFSFPSLRPAVPGFDRRIAGGAAFGEFFTHDGGPMYRTDLPLDPFYGVPLALEKSADKTRVATGEAVIFTLTAVNNMDEALIGAEIVDRIPQGADLIPGSVEVDGALWADPRLDFQGDHIFDIDLLRPRETRVLSYAVRFSPLARQGRNYNSAVLSGLQAGSGQARTSAVASTFVKLDDRGGVFSREATIIGSVFLDCDGDGMRGGADEPGIPGAKIVTQEGLSVVTDIDGMYSLYGLRPVGHALNLMSRTLPSGTRPAVSRTTDLLRGGSRLVDLKRGELRAERFALRGCTAEALAEVEARRKQFEEREFDGARLQADLPLARDARNNRNQFEADRSTTTQIVGGVRNAGNAPAADLAIKARETAGKRVKLEAIIETLTSEIGFLDLPADGHAPRRTATLRVKGPADLELTLEINGTVVEAANVGERTVWAEGNVQALEFVAVKLSAGQNSLVLTGKDSFGNARAGIEASLTAPGDPARIELAVPRTASATPGSAVPVVVRIVDAAGNPVQASATVTLRAHRSAWDVSDIRPEQPGVQAYIDNGEASFDLLAPTTTGVETIAVVASFGRAEAVIDFTPDLEELVLVGIVEGAVALDRRGDLIEEGRLSPFEDTATGLRGELYLKGRIRGDALLTLRYSSDRDTDDRLFRDIRGDEYYPVYGDSSERGWDAQSSSRLYVKIEKGLSYVLYGDIAIEPESDAFRLGGYRRVTTGAQAHWENDRVSVNVFAAHTAQNRRVFEIPGRGISGPYDVDLDDYREGSERVELLVRDRNTDETLLTQQQRRMTDYSLDYFRGAILFSAPVPQADADGNPVSIRVSYETEGTGNERYWLYGGEVNYQVNDDTSVGLRVVHADAERLSDERQRIRAAYLRARLGPRTTLEVEAAQVENGVGETGDAARILLVREGDRSRLTIEASHADRRFDPPGSHTRPGSDRVSVDYSLEINKIYRLLAEADYVRDGIADTENVRARLSLDRRLSEYANARVGLAAEHNFTNYENVTQIRGLVGASWTAPEIPALSMEVEFEQSLHGPRRHHLSLGFAHELKPGWRLGGVAELALHPSGDRLTRFRFGMEYQLSESLTGRTEFAGADAGGMNTRVINGIRAEWEPSETLDLHFAIEHSEPLSADANRLTSVALGGDWESRDGNWVAEADLDLTFEPTGSTTYLNLGVAGEVTPDLTILGRSRLAVDQRAEAVERVRSRIRLGIAYRPTEDQRLAVLAWYEHRMDKNTHGSATHLWSVGASYQARENLQLNAKYAGEAERIDLGDGGTDNGLTQLVQGGVRYDLGNERFRIGTNAMRLWDSRGNAMNAVGAELGYVLGTGSLVSVGYNQAMGRRLGDSRLYQDGFYLRLRLLLDDSLWDRLGSFGSD